MKQINFRFALISIIICAVCTLAFSITSSARSQQSDAETYLPAAMHQGLSRTNITGKVYSVIDVNRAGIGQVLICLKHTGNCTLSDSTGQYRFDNVRAGSQIITAEDQISGDYARFERSVFLIPDTENQVDILLNPLNLYEEGYRIVLSWNPSAAGQTVDLDANFWLAPGTIENPTGFHITKYIAISNCIDEGSVGSGNEATYNFQWPFAYIDVDNTTGSDIETISIRRLVPGKSTFAVLHAQFAGDPGGDFVSLVESHAVVEVYDNTELIASFQVPPSNVKPGETDNTTWWHVFHIYDTGEIEVINQLTGEYPIDTDSYTCLVVEP